MYTEEKGILTVETTKDNLQRAIKEIDLDLKVLQTVLPGKCCTKNLAFLLPCIIPSHGVSQNYADKIIYNVADNLEQTEKTCNSPPKGTWSRGPLARSYSTKTTESTKTKPTSSLQHTTEVATNVKDKYDAIKKILDDINKNIQMH
eukprot:15336198-Ditylum_brightwellii.AAC.1